MSEAAALPAADPDAPWALAALGTLRSRRSYGVPGGHWVDDPSPTAIPLADGIPDPESLPVEALLAATATALREQGKSALRYGGGMGHPALRAQIAARIDPQLGLGYTEQNVVLTNGSAQALQMIADTFLDPGDAVIVEAPAWGGILRMLSAFGAVAVGVPVDDDGIQADAVEAALTRLAAEGRRAKLIYTIPTFQNPMGVTSTLARRRALIDVAHRHQVLIVEDDPYGELRFSGQAVPSLLSLSGGDGVLRCGSFSKIIASGLRVGWIQAAKPFIDTCVQMRFDNGTSPFAAHVISAYIDAGSHEPQLARLRAVYRAKSDVMLTVLEETCADYATWTRPEGGYFVWLTVPDAITLPALSQAAAAEGVQFIPGPSFFPKGSGGGAHSIRLCFSYEPEDRIAEGTRRLARAIQRAGRER